MSSYRWFNSAYDRNVIHRPQESMVKGFRDVLRNIFQVGAVLSTIPGTVQGTVADQVGKVTGQPTEEQAESHDYGMIGNAVGTVAAGGAALYGMHLINKVRNNIAANSYRTSTPDENGQPGGSATSKYGKNTTANDVIEMSENTVEHKSEESDSKEHSSIKSMSADVRSLQILTKTLLSSLH